MTLNKFCPVAQGEYYNNKSPRKSQHFFPVFSKFFLLYVQYLHFVITPVYKYHMWIIHQISSYSVDLIPNRTTASTIHLLYKHAQKPNLN